MTDRSRLFTGSIYEEMAGYARAVIVGDMIFISGTVGYDFATKTLPQGADAQARQCLKTISETLARADSMLADIVRVVVYVPNPDDVPAVAAVLKEHLGANPPANTTVCAQLAVPECAVEIEVTAIRSQSSNPG